MPHSKTAKAKNPKKAATKKLASPVIPAEETLEDGETPLVAKKITKPIEIDEEEVIAPVEKLAEEVVSPFGEVPSEDDAEDDAGLDEEELNPFGDKWEV